jgi:hypothetical protein
MSEGTKKREKERGNLPAVSPIRSVTHVNARRKMTLLIRVRSTAGTGDIDRERVGREPGAVVANGTIKDLYRQANENY